MRNAEDLIDIVSEVLEIDRSLIHMDMRLGDLSCWNSLKHVEILLTAEEKLGLQIDVYDKDLLSLNGILKKCTS